MASASILRWPGAKTRAVSQILPHFPRNASEVASIFLGGGSVELALCAQGVKVWGYDACSYLINYWQVMLRNPERLANRMESLFLPKMQAMDRQFFYQLCMSSAEVGILGGRISGEFQPQMMVLGCFGLSPYAA